MAHRDEIIKERLGAIRMSIFNAENPLPLLTKWDAQIKAAEDKLTSWRPTQNDVPEWLRELDFGHLLDNQSPELLERAQAAMEDYNQFVRTIPGKYSDIADKNNTFEAPDFWETQFIPF